jgi:DNA-binding LacI/PurR family transcriptional regulator
MSQCRDVIVLAPNFTYTFPKMVWEKLKVLAVDSGTSIRNSQILTGASTLGEPSEKHKYKTIRASVKNPTSLIGIAVKPDAESVEMLAEAGITVVLIDEVANGASTITADNRLGGTLAAEYLISKGYKYPAIICGRTDINGGYNAQERLEGFRSSLTKNRISLSADRIKEVQNYSYFEGVTEMSNWVRDGLISKAGGIDIVFSAAGDDCAAGVLRAAKSSSIEVPNQVAILGYDDFSIAKTTAPPLTTIHQPLDEMVARAFEIATEPSDKYLFNPVIVTLEPHIEERQST